MLICSLLLLASPQLHAGSFPSGTPRSPGSLTTLFASNNGYAGNMFDITPAVDLTLTAVDVNTSAVGLPVTADVWYRSGTSFGNENSAVGWTLLASGSGTGMGTDLPTFIDLSGNGVTFLAGQSYGIYIDLTSYSTGTTMKYTNATAPNTYANADLSLLTNCGKGPGFTGSTFQTRDWNGTIYYDTGSSGPHLTITGLVAGGVALGVVTNATPGALIYLGYSLAGPGPTSTPWGDLDLSPPYVSLPPLIADPSGNASVTAPVPAGTTGIPIWMHGFDRGTHSFTNPLAMVIG